MSLRHGDTERSGLRHAASSRAVDLFQYVMAVPSTLYILLFLGAPALFLLFLAMTSNFFSVFQPTTFVGAEHFLTVLSSSEFWLYLGNTLVYATAVVVGGTILQLGIALALNVDLPYKRVWQTIFILPWAIPFVISTLMWKLMFNPQFGLINYLLLEVGIISTPIQWFGSRVMAFISVIIPTVWIGTPLGVLIILAGLNTIPDDLYEASYIDGASAWSRFRHITLPLLKPSLRTVVLIHSLVALRGFDIIYAMTRGGPGNMTTVISIDIYQRLIRFGQYSYAAAEAIILIAIILITLAFLVRVFSTDYELEAG